MGGGNDNVLVNDDGNSSMSMMNQQQQATSSSTSGTHHHPFSFHQYNHLHPTYQHQQDVEDEWLSSHFKRGRSETFSGGLSLATNPLLDKTGVSFARARSGSMSLMSSMNTESSITPPPFSSAMSLLPSIPSTPTGVQTSPDSTPPILSSSVALTTTSTGAASSTNTMNATNIMNPPNPTSNNRLYNPVNMMTSSRFLDTSSTSVNDYQQMLQTLHLSEPPSHNPSAIGNTFNLYDNPFSMSSGTNAASLMQTASSADSNITNGSSCNGTNTGINSNAANFRTRAYSALAPFQMTSFEPPKRQRSTTISYVESNLEDSISRLLEEDQYLAPSSTISMTTSAYGELYNNNNTSSPVRMPSTPISSASDFMSSMHHHTSIGNAATVSHHGIIASNGNSISSMMNHQQAVTTSSSTQPHYHLYDSTSSNSFMTSMEDYPTIHEESSFAAENPISRCLWIGHFDTSLVTTQELASLFSEFGTVEAVRMLEERDCAFVHFSTTREAIRAKESMDGMCIGKSKIRIGFGKFDTPKNEYNETQPSKSIWVGNLSPDLDPSYLGSLFSAFGPIESARILTHKNCGFVNFISLSDAIKAKDAMGGVVVHGYQMKTGFAKVPKQENQANIYEGIVTPPLSRNHSVDLTPTKQAVVNAGVQGGFYPLTPKSSASTLTSSSNTIVGNMLQKPLLHSQNNNPQSVVMETFDNDDYEATSPLLFPTLDDSIWETSQNPSLASKSRRTSKSSISGNEEMPNVMMPTLPVYAKEIPPLPEPSLVRRVNLYQLRDIRKKLEGNTCTSKDIELFHAELYDDVVDLATDHVGNVVIQNIVEKGNDQIKLSVIRQLALHLASMGIHKNGTWVVQKIIETARTSAQIQEVVMALEPYTPPLMHDQFGNYVIQCCLRLGTHRNQFIFNAMECNCIDIGFGRFGARSMRSCLESQFTTKRQQKQVAMAIVQNVDKFSMHPNGIILINWLLDTSGLTGRYRSVANHMLPKLVTLCTHKLASSIVLKLVNQRVEPDAREMTLDELFYKDSSNILKSILLDYVFGLSVVHKILSSSCTSSEERLRIAEQVQSTWKQMSSNENKGKPLHQTQTGAAAYRRLLDQISKILGGGSATAHQVTSAPCIPIFETPHVGIQESADGSAPQQHHHHQSKNNKKQHHSKKPKA